MKKIERRVRVPGHQIPVFKIMRGIYGIAVGDQMVVVFGGTEVGAAIMTADEGREFVSTVQAASQANKDDAAIAVMEQAFDDPNSAQN